MGISVDTAEVASYVDAMPWHDITWTAEHGCRDAIIWSVRRNHGRSAYADALLRAIVRRCEGLVFRAIGVDDPGAWQRHGFPPSLARVNPDANPDTLAKLATALEVGPDDLRQLQIDPC